MRSHHERLLEPPKLRSGLLLGALEARDWLSPLVEKSTCVLMKSEG
jgi:hypothetical protein